MAGYASDVDVPVLVLCFAALLVVGVLISELADRTVISTAVLFLAGGFVLGPGVLEVLDIQSGDEGVTVLAELALFAVLYSDGMKVGIGDLRRAWRLPGRALILGLPLTLGITAALAHFVVGLSWVESLLLGAVLAPTDPVFASAIVGRQEVPGRLRHLLNVESGINDGLALPIVLVLITAAGGTDTGAATLAGELALGLLIGFAVPYGILLLERSRYLAARRNLEPLVPTAIGLLVLGLCLTTHANLFLAAFTAGVTVASMSQEFRHQFEQLGELVAEQLKLVAILVFAALLTPSFLFEETPLTGWVLAVLVLVVARPLALLIALTGARLNGREKVAVMWFGPKGFASVVYGLLVLESGIEQADLLFHLVGITIALSILAHSSTDVALARRFREAEDAEGPGDSAEDAGTNPRPGTDAR